MKTTLLKNIYSLLLAAVIVSGILSCDNKRNKEVDPTAEFSKIYDNQKFNESYSPLDIKPVSDGGFIILGRRRIESSAFFGIYTMKIDEVGQFVSENLIDETYVSPLSSIVQIGSQYFFVCMDPISLETKLMSISEDADVSEIATIPVLYPVAIGTDGSSILVLNYDRDGLEMEACQLSTSGALTGYEEFSIGIGASDIVEKVVDHLTGNGTTLPFLIGNAGGTYYFNGYRDHNLSFVYFTFGGSSTNIRSILGYYNEHCVSSALSLGGTRFAMSRFDNGSNYINTNMTANFGANAEVLSVGGNAILEFIPNEIPVVKQLSIAGKELLVFGGTTKSGQMALYFYEASSGSFVASHYLGYSHPYVFRSMDVTEDGGLIVTGTVYIAGRFERICVFKLSEDQMDAKLNGTDEDDKKKKK